MWTDPEDLLPGSKDLLNEDFNALGSVSAINQLLWAAEVETAMAAANHGRTDDKDNKQAEETTMDSNPTSAIRIGSRPGEKDGKGSGAWKKERWKNKP